MNWLSASVVGVALALAHHHNPPPPPLPAPPAFTGNGTGISEQGGKRKTISYYVRGGWIDDGAVIPPGKGNNCNQRVYDGAGNPVGVYVDDAVNTNWPDHSIEDNCVRADVALGYTLIIAASPLSSPDWNFAPLGATYTAFEWYPYCGSTDFLSGSTVPHKAAYIIQYNFVFQQDVIGLGTGSCPPTPHSKIVSLIKLIRKQRPEMILYF